MTKLIDLTGMKFNRLTVIKRVDNIGKNVAWLCKCDCGNETIVAGNELKNGRTKSCGCLIKEKVRERQTSHGLRYTRLYGIWKEMKSRCNNENAYNYKNYGGRGIKVCDEWSKNIKTFYDWAMVNGYKDDLTIDRINVNGNYEPKNCRWVDIKTQNRNKRNNHIITYNGEMHCLSEWAEKLKIKYAVLWQRIFVYNWSIEKAFTTKVRGN